jgi:hypothetical protein
VTGRPYSSALDPNRFKQSNQQHRRDKLNASIYRPTFNSVSISRHVRLLIAISFSFSISPVVLLGNKWQKASQVTFCRYHESSNWTHLKLWACGKHGIGIKIWHLHGVDRCDTAPNLRRIVGPDELHHLLDVVLAGVQRVAGLASARLVHGRVVRHRASDRRCPRNHP